MLCVHVVIDVCDQQCGPVTGSIWKDANVEIEILKNHENMKTTETILNR
jgi:hypothetical protein